MKYLFSLTLFLALMTTASANSKDDSCQALAPTKIFSCAIKFTCGDETWPNYFSLGEGYTSLTASTRALIDCTIAYSSTPTCQVKCNDPKNMTCDTGVGFIKE